MSDPRNLGGVWYGRYDATSYSESNSFIARLEDSGGGIAGVITEPCDRAGVRRAFVLGTRDGAALQFVKQYDGAVFAHAVRYTGTVNDDATEVSGRWIVGRGQGRFVMTREKFGADELEADEESELEAKR